MGRRRPRRGAEGEPPKSALLGALKQAYDVDAIRSAWDDVDEEDRDRDEADRVVEDAYAGPEKVSEALRSVWAGAYRSAARSAEKAADDEWEDEDGPPDGHGADLWETADEEAEGIAAWAGVRMAKALDEGGDPAKALAATAASVAGYQVARAARRGTMDSSKRWWWSLSGAHRDSDACDENVSASPLTSGESWPAGIDPHIGCLCVVSGG